MNGLCAIWKTRTLDSERSPSRDVSQYDSPRAGGRYEISGSAAVNLNILVDSQKAYLTSWLVDQRGAGIECPTVDSTVVEFARVAAPRSITERRDRLIREIARHTPALGQTMRYYELAMMAAFSDKPYQNPHWAESDSLLAATESLDLEEVATLVRFATSQGLLMDKSGDLSLTFDGFAHLDVLRGTAADSLQAFVAMWFASEVSAAYANGIAPAITDAGYRPMRIDQKEHNNKIDDEIIAEIRRSRFVVADFTCGLTETNGDSIAIPRGGVYYEAGFAQGLGIPVIWTCREDHIGHVHFDTRQFNHITWKTPEELREKLRNRIGAVLGDGPLAAR